MITLVRESSNAADLLDDAASELQRDRQENETIDFIDDRGCRTVTVAGKTTTERRECILRAYGMELFELLCLPDGDDDFAVLDRAGVLHILEDPLSPPTRIARRNLIVASVLVFLMGATRQSPRKVPGFDFDLGAHPWIVGGLAVAVLLYQLVSFVLYARADLARSAVAESELRKEARELRRHVSRTQVALEKLEASAIDDSLVRTGTRWRLHASGQLERLEHELSTAGRRRQWDFWLPLPLVVIALAIFAWWLMG